MIKIIQSPPYTNIWFEPQESPVCAHTSYRAVEVSWGRGKTPSWYIREVTTHTNTNDEEITFEEFMRLVKKKGEEGFFKSLKDFMDAKNG